ncbi:MAG: hypothetical protein JWO15_1575 [Sphingomonadales bacterium]|nr:hypothetical protein [Sphingomonadales bacterium]
MRRPKLIEMEFAVLIIVMGGVFALTVFDWLWRLR